MTYYQREEWKYGQKGGFAPIYANCIFCKHQLKLGIGINKLQKHMSRCQVRARI